MGAGMGAGGWPDVDTSKPLLRSRLNSSSRSGVKDRPSESLKLFSRGMITNQERLRTRSVWGRVTTRVHHSIMARASSCRAVGKGDTISRSVTVDHNNGLWFPFGKSLSIKLLMSTKLKSPYVGLFRVRSSRTVYLSQGQDEVTAVCNATSKDKKQRSVE